MSTHTTPVGFVLSLTRKLGTIWHYLRTPCGTLDKREDHKKQRRDCVLLWTTWRFVLEWTLKCRAWGVRCMLGMQQSQARAVCLYSGSLRRRRFRSKRHVPHELSRMVCTKTCRIFPAQTRIYGTDSIPLGVTRVFVYAFLPVWCKRQIPKDPGQADLWVVSITWWINQYEYIRAIL